MKLGPRLHECFFMGYPEGAKGYQVREKSSGAFFNFCDIIFNESCVRTPGAAPDDFLDWVPVCSSTIVQSASVVPTSSLNISCSDPVSSSVAPVVSPTLSSSSLSSLSSLSSIPKSSSSKPSSVAAPTGDTVTLQAALPSSYTPSTCTWISTCLREVHAESLAASRAHRDKLASAHIRHMQESTAGAVSGPEGAESSQHVFDNDYVNLVCSESVFLSIRSNKPRNPALPSYNLNIPPFMYSQAWQHPDFDVWEATVVKELDTLHSMRVYELSKLPEGRKAKGNRWVFELKIDRESFISKGCLVRKGFHQIPHIDFGKTFAPVAKTASIHLVAAMACQHNWHLHCFDAMRAFLWGDLEEELFMSLPDGFRLCPDSHLPVGCLDTSGLVMRLHKSIYGLNQVSNVWYRKLRSMLERLGLKRSEVDHKLFSFFRQWKTKSVQCLIVIHVDDGMGGSNCLSFLKWVKSEILQEFVEGLG